MSDKSSLTIVLASKKILMYDGENTIEKRKKDMKIFQRKVKVFSVPKECQDFEIEIDKSICTGEMTVGFRNPQSGKLMYAELVRSEAEVESYKKKYGKS